MSRSTLALLFLLLPSALTAAIQPGPEIPITHPVLDSAIGVPLVASNGSGYLVAWSGVSSTFAMPVAQNGDSLHEKPIPADSPSRTKRLSDLASDGTNYLLVTASDTRLTTIAIDSDARVIATHVVATVDPFTYQAHIAWNGDKYLLVYIPLSVDGTVTGLFLDRSGAPVGDPFTIIDHRTSAQLALASNGRDFLISGTSFNDCQENGGCKLQLFNIAVSNSGAIGSLQVIAGTNIPVLYSHNLQFTGAHYVLVWSDSLATFRSVNEVPLDASGQPERAASVIATGDQTTVTLALSLAATRDGAVAFVQHSQTIRAVRIDRDGNPVDSEPVEVFDTPTVGDVVMTVDAASIGSDVFTTWTEWRRTPPSFGAVSYIEANRVDFSRVQTGHAIGGAAVEETLLDLASNGRTQLALTITRGALERGGTLLAHRLVNGVPSGEPVALLEPQLVDPITSIATHGDDFLVVTAEFGDGGRNIRARLLANGSSPTNIIDLGTGSDSPFAIWTGDHYLVLWTTFDLTAQVIQQNVKAVRVSASGQLLDTTPRTVGSRPDFTMGYSRIVSTPSGLVMFFLHGTQTSFRFSQVLLYDVYASRISADGDLIGEPVQITDTPDIEQSINVATDPGGDMFVTWIQSPLDFHFALTGTHARGAVLTSDLSVVQMIDFAVSRHPRAVAWSGSAFITSWFEDQIYAQRFSKSGDATSDAIALTDDGARKRDPFLVDATGGAYVAYTRPLPEASGSDALRAVGRMLYDNERRRAVKQR